MSELLFDLPVAEQVAVAREKLRTRALDKLGVRMPLYDVQYAQSTLLLYGYTARHFVAAANYTAAADECGAPSGFELHCSPRAPMWALPFEQRPLASGIVAFPIAVGANGERAAQLDLSSMIQRRDETHRAMLATIDSGSELGGTGDPAAFAGIYWKYTEQRRPTFYAVARAHSPALSAQLMQRVRDAEPESMAQVNQYVRQRLEQHDRFHSALETRQRAERGELERDSLSRDEELRELASGVGGELAEARRLRVPYTTWDEFFFRTPEVTRLAEAQATHRARVAALVLRAAGIPIDERANSLDEQVRLIEQSADKIDCPTNWVDQVDSADDNSSIVFMANVTSSVSKTSAASAAGSVVVQTDPTSELAVVSAPFRRVQQCIGVPISAGPRRAVANRSDDDDDNGDGDIDSVPPRECVYTPRSAADPSHAMFARTNWHSLADVHWRAAEKQNIAPISSKQSFPLRIVAARLADPH